MVEEVEQFNEDDVDSSINIEEYLAKETEEETRRRVEAVTPIQQWLVNYVGDKLKPENNEVTLELLVKTVAEEFPDFVLAIAKENWIRGYQQAFTDIENNNLPFLDDSQQEFSSEQENEPQAT